MIYCAKLCQWSLLYTAGGLGVAVSSLAGPGQSAGGGEAPGSSEKFAFYSTKKRPENTCVVRFVSVLNTIIKSCQVQLTH